MKEKEFDDREAICPLCGSEGYCTSSHTIFIGKELKAYSRFICFRNTCRNIFHGGIYGYKSEMVKERD